MNKRDKKRLNVIKKEFKRGFDYLKNLKGVTIFGSARTKPGDKYYIKAERLAFDLAVKGFPIITGAGLGIMEAANKGAYEADGISVGLNIKLEKFQNRNKYINRYICFKHFYVRKVMFTKYSFASVVFPGGYGTLDELFDLLAVLQNKKVRKRPVIIFSKAYYSRLLETLNDLVQQKRVSKKDLKLFTVTDDIDETVAIIEREHKRTQKFFI
jgi:hypothetical protein